MSETVKQKTDQGSLSYLWHWWINSLPKDGPAGCPHKRHLYGFKSALESLGYFETYLRSAFTDSLRQTHQQCSLQAPEAIPSKNAVHCALGKCVTECPILLSLKESFEKHHDGYYKERVPAEALYELMARTCAWHMLMEEIDGRLIDWNEGAMQDQSDRIFWDRVYDSLAQADQAEDAEPRRES
jgi:hypothetical protein